MFWRSVHFCYGVGMFGVLMAIIFITAWIIRASASRPAAWLKP